MKQEKGQNQLLKDSKEFSEYLGKRELETSPSSVHSMDIAPVIQANRLAGIPSYEKKALHSQAHWFMYTSSPIPFTIFSNKLFKQMLI